MTAGHPWACIWGLGLCLWDQVETAALPRETGHILLQTPGPGSELSGETSLWPGAAAHCGPHLSTSPFLKEGSSCRDTPLLGPRGPEEAQGRRTPHPSGPCLEPPPWVRPVSGPGMHRWLSPVWEEEDLGPAGVWGVMRGALGWGGQWGRGYAPPRNWGHPPGPAPGSPSPRGWQILSCVLCGTTRRSGNRGRVMAAGGWAPAAAGVPGHIKC